MAKTGKKNPKQIPRKRHTNTVYFKLLYLLHLRTLLKKECSRFIVFLKCVMHRNSEYPELGGSWSPARPAPSMLSPFPSHQPPGEQVLPKTLPEPPETTRSGFCAPSTLSATTERIWLAPLYLQWPLSSRKFHRPSYINPLPLLILNKRHWFDVYSQNSLLVVGKELWGSSTPVPLQCRVNWM